VPLKIARLRQWCEDLNAIQREVSYGFVYVDQEEFEKYPTKTFRALLDTFEKYKEDSMR